MKLSVIIPTYNRAALLYLTLKALVNQSLAKNDFEVIISDDGSSDETEDMVREFEDLLNIEYIRQWDKGFRAAAARNLGIAAARGNLCLFADCGVLLHSDALAVHIKSHERSRDNLYLMGYVYGFAQDNSNQGSLLELLGEDVDASIGKIKRSGLHKDIREPLFTLIDDEISLLPAAWAICFTCLASVERQRLLDVGLFDANFKTWGGEDDDLAYRLIRSGLKPSVTREGSGIHYPHDKKADENQACGRENSRYMFTKYKDPMILDLIENGWYKLNAGAYNKNVES